MRYGINTKYNYQAPNEAWHEDIGYLAASEATYNDGYSDVSLKSKFSFLLSDYKFNTDSANSTRFIKLDKNRVWGNRAISNEYNRFYYNGSRLPLVDPVSAPIPRRVNPSTSNIYPAAVVMQGSYGNHGHCMLSYEPDGGVCIQVRDYNSSSYPWTTKYLWNTDGVWVMACGGGGSGGKCGWKLFSNPSAGGGGGGGTALFYFNLKLLWETYGGAWITIGESSGHQGEGGGLGGNGDPLDIWVGMPDSSKSKCIYDIAGGKAGGSYSGGAGGSSSSPAVTNQPAGMHFVDWWNGRKGGDGNGNGAGKASDWFADDATWLADSNYSGYWFLYNKPWKVKYTIDSGYGIYMGEAMGTFGMPVGGQGGASAMCGWVNGTYQQIGYGQGGFGGMNGDNGADGQDGGYIIFDNVALE